MRPNDGRKMFAVVGVAIAATHGARGMRQPPISELCGLALVFAARPCEVAQGALAAHKRVGRVRHLYGIGLAEILSGEITGPVLKRRELVCRLDVVGLRLAECADAMLKRAV
jgi:hypothetical protein